MIDARTCDQCRRVVKVIACIQDPAVLDKTLTHLTEPPAAPASLSHSRVPPQAALSPDGLQRIQRSVQRMEHTVEGLLALARQEQQIDGASMEQEWKAMLEEYREGFGGSISSSREWDPKEPLAARMIVLATGALLRNAIQHANASSITLALSQDGLTLSDNGQGMEDLDSIREALDRGHPLPCGGLGLALVARICRRMDWTLSLENNNGLQVAISF